MIRRAQAAWLGAGVIAGLGLVLWLGSGPAPLTLGGWLRTTGPGFAAALMVLLALWGLGSLLNARLLPDTSADDAIAAHLTTLAVGLGVAVAVTSALGILGLAHGSALRLLVGVGLIGAWRSRPRGRASSTGFSAQAIAVGALAVALLLPGLFTAGAPPVGPDELQYHVRFVRHLVVTGSFVGDLQDPTSGFPQGIHSALGLAWSLGGERALRPLAFLIGVAGLWAGQRVAVALGGDVAGWAYVPIALGASSVLRLVPSIGSDATQMLLVAGSALIVVRLARRDEGLLPGEAIALAVLGGAAFSIKYTAVIVIGPLWVAVLLLQARRGGVRSAVVPLLMATGIPLAFAAPWLVKNLAIGAHPLWPLTGWAVPEGLDRAFRFSMTEQYGAGPGLRAALRAPIDLFLLGLEFDRRHFLGRLSPWPLLAAPLVVLAARDRAVRLVALVTLAGFAAWTIGLRRVVYLLPLWPLIAAVTAAGVAAAVLEAEGKARARLLAVTAALLVGVAVVEVAPAWVGGLAAASVASGQESVEEHRDAQVRSAPAAQWLRGHVPREEAIVGIFMWEVPATDHRFLWACAEECVPVRLALAEAGSPDGARARLRDLGVRWLVVRETVFVRSAYPGLSDAEFEGGYAQPMRILDGLLVGSGRLRFSSGGISVYELDD